MKSQARVVEIDKARMKVMVVTAQAEGEEQLLAPQPHVYI